MKTKDLIKLLQEADPSGEGNVVVGNADIHFIEPQPAYYDGCMQVLIRDPALAPYYNIVGAKYQGKGNKLNIHTLSISDAIANDPEIPIYYENLSADQTDRYRSRAESWRREVIDIRNDNLDLKNSKGSIKIKNFDTAYILSKSSGIPTSQLTITSLTFSDKLEDYLVESVKDEWKSNLKELKIQYIRDKNLRDLLGDDE